MREIPNRIIKESICTSDTIDQLSWFEETFFYRLIVNCDDYGRFDARAPILKARLFPLKNVTEKQVSAALNKLSTVGIVTVYKYDGRPYLQLVTWDNHQQIRAKRSKYPAFDESCNQMISDDIECPRNPIQSESESESNIYSSVIDYLNEKAATNYKHTSKKTQELIHARTNEKFTLDDFKTVIDKKVAEWMGGDMEKFLRPETLFGTKFEGYLNQKIIKPQQKPTAVNKANFEQRKYSDDDFEKMYKV